MDVKRIVLGAAILLVVVAGILYVSGRREQPAPEQVAELPVLLEFMMPTWPACKAMEPVVSDLEKKHGGRINVTVVDVYENMERASEYKVRVVPTMFLLDGNGEVLERIEGYMNLEQLESMLEKHGIL